jgi:L-iditol 2-dehydrogenase
MKMKAARLCGPQQVRVEQVDVPPAGENEVLVRIATCGVCPSDVRFYAGTRADAAYPLVAGHEWVGEVMEVGVGVRAWHVGDRVAAFKQRVCGMCRNCQRGMSNMCLHRLPAIDGGFCEVGRAMADALVAIPDGVSDEQAAFTEPLACCYNGISRTPIAAGDTVAIMGVGPIGQMLAQLARLRGARVVAVDLDAERLALARELGAAETLSAADERLAETIKDLTGGHGADAVVVAVGAPQAAETAFRLVGAGGCVNLFAGTYPPATVAIDPNLIHYKQLWVTGSYHYTPGGFRTALELIRRGDVQVSPLVSHRFPLDETAAAFETVTSRQGMKVMVQMG